MAEVKFTKLSSRGQVVIPKELREGMEEGTPFAVIRDKDTIVLKKIEIPGMKEFEELVNKGVRVAKRLKLKEEDIDRIVHGHKSVF